MIMPQAPELSVYAARRLAAAGRYVFTWPITAYLTDVLLLARCATGRTYHDCRADAWGQFHDGHLICTSAICFAEQCGPYWCLHTASGSVYVVVTFAAWDGRPSLARWLASVARGRAQTPAGRH
ncbi:hypothetical protein ACEOTE_23875 [Pseudomonas aeruginosa]